MNIKEMLKELDNYRSKNPNATQEEIDTYWKEIENSRVTFEGELWDTFKDEIKYKYQKVVSFFRTIGTGIKNLWLWKGIIWNDRWWDSSFIDTIISFKLQTMVDNWDKAHYVCSGVDKLDMERIVLLYKDIEALEDEFTSESDKAIDKAYERIGRLMFSVTERNFECKDDGEIHTIKNKMANIRRWWD